MPDNLRYMYAEHLGKKVVVGARRLSDDYVRGTGKPVERWDITFHGNDHTYYFSPTMDCEFEPGDFRLIGEVPLVHDTAVVEDEDAAWSAGTLLDAVQRIVEDAVSLGMAQGLGSGELTQRGIRDSAVEDILRALAAAKIHAGSTLAEVVAQTEHLKSIVRRGQEAPEGGWRLTVREGQIPILARQFFEACWGPEYLMDKTLLQGHLEQGVPAMLELVQQYATLNGIWPLAHCHEALQFVEIENSALRRNLVWLAGRPGITLETRRELSARIRDLHGFGYVPEDSAEEVEAEIRHYARIADNVCDLVQEIIDWRASRREGAATEKKPRMYWDSQAETAIRTLREFTPKKFETTLAGVREVRNGK